MYLLDFLNGGVLDLRWWQVILATLLLTHITIAAVTIFLQPDLTRWLRRLATQHGQ